MLFAKPARLVLEYFLNVFFKSNWIFLNWLHIHQIIGLMGEVSYVKNAKMLNSVRKLSSWFLIPNYWFLGHCVIFHCFVYYFSVKLPGCEFSVLPYKETYNCPKHQIVPLSLCKFFRYDEILKSPQKHFLLPLLYWVLSKQTFPETLLLMLLPLFSVSLSSIVRENRVSSNDCNLLNQNFVLNNISQEVRYWSNLHCVNKKIDSSLDLYFRMRLI